VSAPAVVASTAASTANASGELKLHPDGFGSKSFAAWRPHEGLPDSKGNTNFGLYFQKMTTTATNAAGVARITGLEGQPLSALVGLSWEHRIDGWCGAGAPRWDVIVTDESGNRGIIFFGCAASVHTPGSAENWIKDTFIAPGVSTGEPVAGIDPGFDGTGALTISELLIVFDEGTDIPANPGFVVLDNITVNDTVFTGPADNGNGN
jgi:hypothetical protein